MPGKIGLARVRLRKPIVNTQSRAKRVTQEICYRRVDEGCNIRWSSVSKTPTRGVNA